MEVAAISQVWRVAKWLPAFILNKFFTAEKLAGAIRLDIRSRHTTVRLDLNQQCPQYEVWFELGNNTPFDVALDRADFEFTFAGVTGTTAQYIRKTRLASGQQQSFVLRGDLTDYRADQRTQNEKQYDSSITINALFLCKVREFPLYRHIEGIKPECVNASSRAKQNNHARAV